MKHLLLYVLLIPFSFSCFGQKSSGRIIYKIRPITLEGKAAKDNPLVQETKKISEAQTFELAFNQSLSKFTLIKNLTTDETDDNLSRLASITFTTEDTYFTEKKSNKQIVEKHDGTLVEKESLKKDWTITSETKKIGNYICTKATLDLPIINRKGEKKTIPIVAWFAPAIPSGYGPKEFYGLPGLILELTERQTTYLVSKITWVKNSEIKIAIPKGKKISEAEYLKNM
ncbi:GLPGLI family protein [Flavobacterium sp. NST-5]|uniref:GLPGLI family protein n=1 Tax=Flavobacterium ichthyis TaxID=2698827 RepID=A0ABW9Z6S8_9FLAO|nr:GLPGLI family protein [Flavobacterium ichthyis]NBL64562.1 GLPGLI family protein [Flavobacterium ichthyis]